MKKPTQRILLTGFKPFGSLDTNPTERLMNTLAANNGLIPQVQLQATVLDTDYLLCEQQFAQAVAAFDPDVVLSFGVNYRTDAICLERVARNLDSAGAADTNGRIRQQLPIVPDGPETLAPTLPLTALHTALEEAGIPVIFSDDAGGYVCNHLFYYGRFLLQQHSPQAIMGFIHVPPLPEQVETADRTGMPLETLVKMVQVCVAVINQG